MTNSERKKYAAEQVLAGGVRSGEYVWVEMPGDPLPIKVYAPWESRPEGVQERAVRQKLARELRRARIEV